MENVSTFAYVGNNPISQIDPDGREFFTALAIGALIGAAINTTTQVIQNNGFNNWSWGSFGISALTGAIGGGVGSSLSGSLGIGNTLMGSVARGALSGGVSGGLSGGVGAVLSGGNFWSGFTNGGISGLVLGGITTGGDFLKTRASFRAFQARTAGANTLSSRGASALEVGADDGWGGGFNRPVIRPLAGNVGGTNTAGAGNVINTSGRVVYGGYNIPSAELRGNLERFADYLSTNGFDNAEVTVSSGLRTAQRNAAVGGARGSRHIVGDAADFSVTGLTNSQAAQLAHDSQLFNSTIYYPQSNVTGALRPHVHVDMNPSHGNSLMIYRPRVNASGMVNHTYSQWNPR